MARNTLGRGLDSLLAAEAAGKTEAMEIPLDAIVPNPFQPRRGLRAESLDSLVQSIKQNGLVQPIVVRPHARGYELVVGERRWRAAQKAGLSTITAVVRNASDRDSLAVALIENLEREDLNAIEVAEAYERLRTEFNLTQEEVARTVGRDRASVANYLRLLRLPRPIRDDLARGLLSMGHARALLSLPSEEMQFEARKAIVERQLSVREVEKWAASHKKTLGRRQRVRKPKDVFHIDAESRLQRLFGTRVAIVSRSRGGHLEIHYSDEGDLARIVEMLEARASHHRRPIGREALP